MVDGSGFEGGSEGHGSSKGGRGVKVAAGSLMWLLLGLRTEWGKWGR